MIAGVALAHHLRSRRIELVQGVQPAAVVVGEQGSCAAAHDARERATGVVVLVVHGEVVRRAGIHKYSADRRTGHHVRIKQKATSRRRVNLLPHYRNMFAFK